VQFKDGSIGLNRKHGYLQGFPHGFDSQGVELVPNLSIATSHSIVYSHPDIFFATGKSVAVLRLSSKDGKIHAKKMILRKGGLKFSNQPTKIKVARTSPTEVVIFVLDDVGKLWSFVHSESGTPSSDACGLLGRSYSGDQLAGELHPVALGNSKSPTACVDIANGPSHCVAVKDTGSVYTWGNGADGKLGTGGVLDVLLPTKIWACGAAQAWCDSTSTHLLLQDGRIFSCGKGRVVGQRTANKVHVELSEVTNTSYRAARHRGLWPLSISKSDGAIAILFGRPPAFVACEASEDEERSDEGDEDNLSEDSEDDGSFEELRQTTATLMHIHASNAKPAKKADSLEQVMNRHLCAVQNLLEAHEGEQSLIKAKDDEIAALRMEISKLKRRAQKKSSKAPLRKNEP